MQPVFPLGPFLCTKMHKSKWYKTFALDVHDVTSSELDVDRRDTHLEESPLDDHCKETADVSYRVYFQQLHCAVSRITAFHVLILYFKRLFPP